MSTKQNYQLVLDKTLDSIKKRGLAEKPSLLLHACCAPCSSYVLEYLSEHFNITLLFYNPNITEREEHDFRYSELHRLVKDMGLEGKVGFVNADYEPKRFWELAGGMENLPEGSERCRRCYALRLEKAAQIAKDGGFDYFTTTLSISPYKRADWLCEIGESLEEKYGVPYLVSDFKKRNGYKRSCELSAKYSLYRQDYCGCVFSKKDAGT